MNISLLNINIQINFNNLHFTYIFYFKIIEKNFLNQKGLDFGSFVPLACNVTFSDDSFTFIVFL